LAKPHVRVRFDNFTWVRCAKKRTWGWELEVAARASLTSPKAFRQVRVILDQRQDLLHFLVALHADKEHLQEQQQR
jgi:hypothetical protein